MLGEVHIQSFPPTGEKWQITNAGGGKLRRQGAVSRHMFRQACAAVRLTQAHRASSQTHACALLMAVTKKNAERYAFGAA
jgi:hypothetical protein